MEKYDLVIIGAGPGGYVAAIRSAQKGLKTLIIEKNKLGGTCLNIGCIPTKALVKNAETLKAIRNAPDRGLEVSAPQVNMEAVVKTKNEIVKQLTGGVQMLLRANGVEVISGEAKVISDNKLSVEGKEISFEKLIIATGSSNFIPPIPGLDSEGILTSTETLDLDYLPKSLLIIGGGVIGCEFATIFSSYGSQVTIVEMEERLVPMVDKDISNSLKNSLLAYGVKVMTNCKVSQVDKEDKVFKVQVEGVKEEIVEVTDLLVAVGRSANLNGLEALDLEMDDRNKYIKVNDRLETSKRNIYAIGDVTGKIMLAHVASSQGIVAVDNISGEDRIMPYDVVPNCIYTIPEIGSVGLTEEEARKSQNDLLIGNFPMMASGKALAMGETTGFTKLIAEKTTGKILGCHIIGPNATELIGQVTLLMSKYGTIEDVKDTIYAHPTVSETIFEAACMASGQPIHILT